MMTCPHVPTAVWANCSHNATDRGFSSEHTEHKKGTVSLLGTAEIGRKEREAEKNEKEEKRNFFEREASKWTLLVFLRRRKEESLTPLPPSDIISCLAFQMHGNIRLLRPICTPHGFSTFVLDLQEVHIFFFFWILVPTEEFHGRSETRDREREKGEEGRGKVEDLEMLSKEHWTKRQSNRLCGHGLHARYCHLPR